MYILTKNGHISRQEGGAAMKEKDLKALIKKAGEEGSKKSQKIKTLEYRMDFGSVTATVSMSLN